MTSMLARRGRLQLPSLSRQKPHTGHHRHLLDSQLVVPLRCCIGGGGHGLERCQNRVSRMFGLAEAKLRRRLRQRLQRLLRHPAWHPSLQQRPQQHCPKQGQPPPQICVDSLFAVTALRNLSITFGLRVTAPSGVRSTPFTTGPGGPPPPVS